VDESFHAARRRRYGGIVEGKSVTFTVSDGKQLQSAIDVVTGTGLVFRVMSF
jgi:hypothetical protein